MQEPTVTPMFLVCGEALYDVFTGETAPGGSLALDARPGGSPLNVAIGLARLGTPVGFFGGLSRDLLGARLIERLKSDGVDTSFVVRSERPTTLSLVGMNADGTPAYTFYGTGTADRSLKADDLPALPAAVRGLHFGSYSLVAEPTADALAALAEREAGIRLISLDPNVRPTVEPDMRVWRRRISAIAARAHVVKASREDLELLWPGKSSEEIAGRWLAAATLLVVVTDGAKGVLAYSRKHFVGMPAESAKVEDTVGAGDAFQAALLHGLARMQLASAETLAKATQADIIRLIAFARRAAAVTCGRRGADLPYASEVEPLL